jgi:integral membrane protein (TIGR01906 family)
MTKFVRVVIHVLTLIFLLMFAAQLLTSRWYLAVSEGRYDTHNEIMYDHDYVAFELIDYLNYRHDDLTFGATESDSTTLMRDIEIRHMEDVKNLYTVLRIVALTSGLSAALLLTMQARKDVQAMYLTLRSMFVIPLMFTVFIGTWFAIDFSRIFTLFHELFFSNDDWLLRYDDVLIQLLPSGFWLVSGVLILAFLMVVEFVFYRFASIRLKRM